MPPIDISQLLAQSSSFILLLLTAAVGFLFGQARDRHSTKLSRETELLTEVRSAAVQCVAAATQIRAVEMSFGFSGRFVTRSVSRLAGQDVELTDEERQYKEARESWSNAVARLRICAPKLTKPAHKVHQETNASLQEWEWALSDFSARVADHLNPPSRMDRLRRWTVRLRRVPRTHDTKADQ